MTGNNHDDPGIDRSKRVIFDRVAQDYDMSRPRYPELLIEEVINLSGIPKGGRILEVGCGPGIATLPFARRGYRMTCVELGAQMSEMARDHCRPYPHVEIVTSAFEDWPLERNAYDLVISAEAFHWIPPEIGYPRAAAALKDGGSAAFFWILNRESNDELTHAIDDVFRRWSTELSAPERELSPGWLIPIITENLRRDSAFGLVTVKQFNWSEEYSSERYTKLLNTRSANQLEPASRQRFLDEIKATVDDHGGSIKTPLVAVLFFARVRK